MKQVTAQLNYLRISPRKVRVVVKVLKGLPVEDAKSQLDYLFRRPSKPLKKLLDSAVSNAVNNHGLPKDYLYIKDIIVNEGIKLKRFKPKGFGLAMPIQKKTSRIKIILDELPENKRKMIKKVEAETSEKKPQVTEEKSKEVKEVSKTPKLGAEKDLAKTKKGAFGEIKNFGRKIFRRKAI